MNISILGDSISTFWEYNPPDYSVYYTPVYASVNKMKSVNDTWWMQLIDSIGANLCVNGSYSGSRVSGEDFPAANSAKRIKDLRTDKIMPDVILVYIGYNDFGYGVEIKNRNKDVNCFKCAYTAMLRRLKEEYPEAVIICSTLAKFYFTDDEYRFNEHIGGIEFSRYNKVIRKAVKKEKCLLVDMDADGFMYETIDGGHPNAKGHHELYSEWLSWLKKYTVKIGI